MLNLGKENFQPITIVAEVSVNVITLPVTANPTLRAKRDFTRDDSHGPF